jgi:hypothetical protein
MPGWKRTPAVTDFGTNSFAFAKATSSRLRRDDAGDAPDAGSSGRCLGRFSRGAAPHQDRVADPR